jgi:hypothetical protein
MDLRQKTGQILVIDFGSVWVRMVGLSMTQLER